MKRPKYIELFYSLSEKEIKEFGKFINSPFFNESKRLVLLYNYLKKETHKKRDNISIEAAVSKLFPDHKPNDEDIRKLHSGFSLLIEEFLTIKSLRRHGSQQRLFLLKELRKRNLDTIFESKLKEQWSLSFDFRLRTKEYYPDRIKFLKEEYLYFYFRHETEKATKASAETDRVTELMYLTLKLNVFINERFEGVYGDKQEKGLTKIESVFNFIETKLRKTVKDEPELYVYYLIAKLIYFKEDVKSVLNINKFIAVNKEHINPDILDYFSNVLFRFCVTRMNLGKYEFSGIAYGIQKEMENDGMFDRMREIPNMTFFSVITIRIYRKETIWAEEFVRKYYGKLNPAVKDETYRVCMALISFANKKYSDVIKYSANLKTKNLAYYLFVKSALLKTYYETGDDKYIHSTADTIEHYIKRKQEMNEMMKRSVSGFLRYVLKLEKAKKEGGRYVGALADMIAEERKFFHSGWVRQKIKELAEKNRG